VIEFHELRDLPIFAGVSDGTLARAAALAADVRLDEGQWLAREGDSPVFYVLLSGTYDLMKKYPDGQRRIAVRDTPGEWLGELPLVLGTPFFAGAIATTPLRAARFERAQFGMLIADSKDFADRLVAEIQVRIEGLEAQAADKLRLPIIVGREHDPDCHDLRDFLSRNQVRFEWANPDDSWVEGRLDLAPALKKAIDCSVVMLPDGRVLERPSKRELAGAVGLQTEPEHDTYDVVIIGGGPTGLAAAVYGASEGLRTLLVEREATGGQAGTSSRIENYLGFPSGVSGDDLAGKAREQALRLGAEIVVTRSIETIAPTDDCHSVTIDGGRVLGARAVILAMGVAYRALEAKGIDDFVGIGCFYGAARTEAAAMLGRDVILVGGGNSAGQAAMFFADYAHSVTILIRGGSLDASMSRYLIDELARKPNVQVRTGGEITEFAGKLRLEKVAIRNKVDGTIDEVAADGVFIFIGADANTEWLCHHIIRDELGYVCTGRDVVDMMPETWPRERDPYLLETSVPGIFAAGDVRHGSIKRVASGVGEGSISIAFVHQHLAEVATRRANGVPTG
jgi:thioredoxin reductase (NADPH)